MTRATFEIAKNLESIRWRNRRLDPNGQNCMLLQEPAESPYDLRFNLFGFPIRVAWSFWIGALIFGFYLVRGVDSIPGGPGLAALYLLWMFCMLVSILIHELGHAVAFRVYGIESSIVLYHFGGLAIPRQSFGMGRSAGQLNSKQDLIVAFAGPFAQFMSGLIVVGVLIVAGLRVPASGWPLSWIAQVVPWMTAGEQITNPGLLALVIFYLWPSFAWAMLNLIPVWPLDGGRITRALILIFGGNTRQALVISLIAAGLMTLYGFKSGHTFLGILFLSLAITNYQLLQQQGDWRY